MKALDRHRPGFSLIEMIIAMAFAVTIMGVLGALVSSVIAANSTSGERLNDLTTLGQLARQFRRDTHSATTATVSPKDVSPATLTLVLEDDDRIEYAIHDDVLRRTRSSATQQDRWEEYPLHSSRVLGWNASDERREVTLTIGRLIGGANASTPAGRTFEIVSRLGEARPATPASETTKPGEAKE